MSSALETIFTIGVYGSTKESFFDALVEYEIELFIDIRARRGMRGARYRYVNSSALQAKLKELGIYYAHLKELAPTKEIRALQWQADREEQTLKRDRIGLSAAYIKAYKKQILKYGSRRADRILDPHEMLDRVRQLAGFPKDKLLQRYVLFCVEAESNACHRSLVAARFSTKIGGKVKHIKPGEELIDAESANSRQD